MKNKSVMKNNTGFSLVELIIVIEIIAMVVGIIELQLIKYVEKANVSSDMQLLDAVYKAVVFASVDPDVMSDDDSRQILQDMNNPASPLKLEDLESARYPAGNRFCSEVLSTLVWDNLQQSKYDGLLRPAHEPNATIYFTYEGSFVNPVIMWVTTTDASGKKDTSFAPTTYSSSTLEEIKSCVHINHIE